MKGARARAGGLLAAAAALLVTACTAPPGGNPTTTSTVAPTTSTSIPGGPDITAFWASPGSTAKAPALVPVGWTVTDPGGDELTCGLDIDGDGTDDLTVADCAGTHSRNVAVPTDGAFVARLTVSDGTASDVLHSAYSIGPDPLEGFDIVLRPQSTLTAPLSAAFAAAESRWESIVIRGIPALTVNMGAGACGGINGAINQSVDDLVIDVDVSPIDGEGGVLGQAGPCVIGGSDKRTRFGIMQFDSADVATMSSSELSDVILHEMGHVLGIGTLWPQHGALVGAGTADPRFVGKRAVAEWSTLGRTGTVPVEGTGGPGTADAHWRESVFNNELMTGYIDNVNPLSALSIASLGDIGLQVDLSQADPYTPPLGALRRTQPEESTRAEMVLITPVAEA